MPSKRIKTDNAHIEWKVDLRRKAVEHLDSLRVLDLFAGGNNLWRSFEKERYYGIEIVKGKGKNLFADNLRVIPALDLAGFNIIDSDSYGSSIKQIEAILSNPTLRPGTIVFFTEIHPPRDILPKEMIERHGLEDIYHRLPSAFQKYAWDYFLDFLHSKGIPEVHVYEVLEKTHMKHYGWFEIVDSSKNRKD